LFGGLESFEVRERWSMPDIIGGIDFVEGAHVALQPRLLARPEDFGLEFFE
jgi:hypothetical protein